MDEPETATSPLPRLQQTRVQLLIGVVTGVVLAVALGQLIPWTLASMAGVILAESVFLVLSLRVIVPMDSQQTADNVLSENLSPLEDELVLVVASAAAIISLVVLGLSQHHGSAQEITAAVFMLLGVFGAWACVQQTYSIHYAYLYYLEDDGGVNFHEEDESVKPRFTDFMYLSYSIGMTYGVTDPEITSQTVRSTVLRHSVLAFVFGMAILGAAINLIAGIFQ